jgi:NAD(P)H-flavin reductase
MSETMARLRITDIKPQTADITLFTMRLADAGEDFAAPAQPGRVAVLRFGEEAPAYFACAHAPHETEWQFLVKRGRGTSGALLEQGVGAEVTLQKIVGRGFDVDAQRGRDLLFVAMGTGVAPLRSALRCVLRERADYGRLVLLQGGRSGEELCFADEHEAWQAAGVEVKMAFTRPVASRGRGYAQDLLATVVPDLQRPVALICGSNAMLEDTRAILLAHHLAPESILTNY